VSHFKKVFRGLLLAAGLILAFSLLTSFSPPELMVRGIFPMSVARGEEAELEEVCVVEDPELNEASGLAFSRLNPKTVWIHNDSGDKPRLFLVGMTGATQAVLTLNKVEPMDWEDMCSFEADGESWLLIGDIGDNGRVRGKSAPPAQLLLVREPKLTVDAAGKKTPATISADVFATIEFTYPDGAVDCESVAVDMQRKEILLLTKTNPVNCRLLRLPLNLNPGKSTAQAEVVASLAVPYATAMDLSVDNRQLAIVNMFSGALIQREESETWQQACTRPARVLTLPARPQGETVCFEPDGKSLLLNSERALQPLCRVKL